MDFGPTISFSNSGGAIALFIIILSFLIHVTFAIGVYGAAKYAEQNGKQLWLVWPIAWAMATLILGPFFAGVYWLIHHSQIGGFNDSALKDLRARREALRNKS